ncbi:hypothetical protein N656DRAFT_841350 [Canariomyces notabilis]|uniref:Uncharacterized protein n=1 Tax=Canariomyces notabilis TaxID=2074819 RepID=A0AAN6TNK9_9PEZI|nr:hypothetical protein N656DRAFT_841350 [Canariomyces arenarius]
MGTPHTHARPATDSGQPIDLPSARPSTTPSSPQQHEGGINRDLASGDETATAPPRAVGTEGTIDLITSGDKQNSKSAPGATAGSVDAQFGSEGQSASSLYSGIADNQGIALVAGVVKGEDKAADAVAVYVVDHQQDRHPRIPELLYNGTVEEQQSEIVAQVTEPIHRLQLLPLGHNGHRPLYSAAIRETDEELNDEESTVE